MNWRQYEDPARGHISIGHDPSTRRLRCGRSDAITERYATPNLSGTSWQLVKFQGSDDKTLTPDDKTKYTVQFSTDGVLSARIDCNRGRGT